MGWTSYNAPTQYKNGRTVIDRKTECNKLFDSERFEILKASMVGSTYYAAVRIRKTGDVFAEVILTRVNTKDYFNFAYKDLDETCGPSEDRCPKSILDLLTPTDSEYANNWRERCRARFENGNRNLGKLPIGSVIEIIESDGKTVQLVKHPPAYQFKSWFWYDPMNHKYRKKSSIANRTFTVIKRGDC